MLKLRRLALFLLLLFSSALNAENLCPLIPGVWYGSYTFLHHRDCKENRGCTHMLDTEIKSLVPYGIEFQAYLTLQMGKQVRVDFECQNSTVTFPGHPEPLTSLSCANGACFIKYQDDNVSATIIHVVTNYAAN